MKITPNMERLLDAKIIWCENEEQQAFAEFWRQHIDVIDVLDALGKNIAERYAYWRDWSGRLAA